MGRAILRVLTFVAVGTVLGILVAHADVSGWLQHWEALPSPPEPPVRIVEAHYQSLIVEAASGNMYDCYIDWGGSCWRAAETYAASSPLDPGCRPRRWPTELHDTVASETVCELGEPHHRFASFAIRDDGTILYWRDTSAEIPVAPYFLYPIASAALSLVIGLGTLFFSWFRTVTTTGRLTTR